MPHSGTSDVREVLGIASGTTFNAGSAEVKNKINEADRLIDKKLDLYNLSVSGTAEALIVDASKYWASALYQQDFYVRRDEKGELIGGQSRTWWDLGSTFLHTYITYMTEDYDRTDTRMRRMWSTTTENP